MSEARPESAPEEEAGPEPSQPRRRPRWRTWVPAGILALLLALYFGYPLLIPLLNPSTHSWQAKLLFTELEPKSALAFKRVMPAFLLDYAFQPDRAAALAEAREQKNALRLLSLGEIEEARTLLEGRVAQHGEQEAPRALLERLAETYLRLAETKNCIGHHAPESCLYPIQGAGVHVDPAPARAALRLYTVLARRYPDDLGYRWLLGLTAMTLGQDPGDLGLEIPKPTGGHAPFPRFVDVAARVGLFQGKAPRSAGGTILEDFDGDGDLDVLLGGYLPEDPLLYYANRGDGTFVDQTEQAGLSGVRGVFRMNQADYDNDGDADVFLVRSGWITRGPNTLLRNTGQPGAARFEDVTAAAGLAEPVEQSMACAWADYDRDGHVDLFVANMAIPPADAMSRLYRNKGDGTFEDVTTRLGIPRLRLCSGATWGDYDDDGDPDLYVSVAFGQNYLLRNDGETFTDVTFSAGVARPLVSFPVWFFDYDNDGRLDLFCGTFWPLLRDEVASLSGARKTPSPATILRLYRNKGDGTFEDVTAAAGLATTVSTMGANAGDLDSDGLLDIYLGTGSPYLAHLVPNRFFHNVGGRFADATYSAGLGHLQKGHGVAFGDVDGDGDQDLLVNLGGAVPVDRFQPALFQNPGTKHHWLGVRLVGTQSNRSGIGARITATLPDGRRVHRVVASGGPFGASPLRVHLGLAQATRVSRLEVRWPSGKTQRLSDLEVDRLLVVREAARLPGGK